MSAVLAIGERTNNAELMRDCAELGYINGHVLDMTYGLGRFWKLYRPERLLTNDLDRKTDADMHRNFTRLPLRSNVFDTVVFDPPYKLNGTGGSHPSDQGYGVANNDTVEERMSLIFAGVKEANRVCRQKGHVLVKCQDQVVSGKKVWQTWLITDTAQRIGLRLVDQLHVRSYRPQPQGRRQVHARGDYSTLLVFRKELRGGG
jgi:DNA modification methylase